MKYVYQARSKEGNIERGTVEASSKEAAALLLQKYNIFVTSIKEQTPLFFRKEFLVFSKKVSKKDLAIFSRQLGVMLQSRVPVVKSLRSLSIQIKNTGFKQKIIKISQFVEEGTSLSDAFGVYPEFFSPFYLSMLKTGEASGKISDVLFYLSDHFEREHDIVSKIKSAMIYPIFVICVLVVVVLIVMFFVMPKLVDLLKEAVTEPPLFTRFMIGFYQFLSNHGWIIILAFVFLILFIGYYFTTKQGRRNFDKLILKVPFVSSFFKKIFLIRFAENIATLAGAGLSINKALKITSDTVENFVYKQIISETNERVSEGEKISSVFIKYPTFIPPFVVQMIQVGEETGKLEKNLSEIVNFYGKEVDRSIATFTALLEPILIVVLGVIVAFLAASIIQPLYGTLEAL